MFRPLDARAVLVGVGAEDAAVPGFWFEERAATGAVIEGHSIFFGHFFPFGVPALRAGDGGEVFDQWYSPIFHAADMACC